jgi:hypothetical protein
VAYVMLFIDPAIAAIIGWCVSMGTRQSGHFFFEPRGFDHVNNATDDYKEAIKVGYNMQRKTVLIAVWALIPVLLWLQPSLFGLIEPAIHAERHGARHRHRLAGPGRRRPEPFACCSSGSRAACSPAWSGSARS